MEPEGSAGPDAALPTDFFDRPARDVALDLVGKTIVRTIGATTVRTMVTETEAYVGPEDLASHAARGRTTRNAPMFGPAGTIYVYRIYGLHWMLNVATGPIGFPAAVLLRGTSLARGPGRLAAAL